jgi:hypothetical protein
MPDFDGRYVLAAAPPAEWKKQIERLAENANVEVRSVVLKGRNLVITCRVPKKTTAAADVVAHTFFEQAVAALSAPGAGSKGAALTHVEPTLPFGRYVLQTLPGVARAIASIFWPVILAVMASIGLAHLNGSPPEYGRVAIAAVAGLIFIGLLEYGFDAYRDRDGSSRRITTEAEAARVVQEAAKDEDPKRWRRIEAARVALRRDTGRMRMDADQLWRRSVRVGRTAVGVFILALAGPAVPAYLLLTSSAKEWYLMFGGFGLAAVPLLIGAAMLRHEAKLREQYREVSREVANLERLDLALEYARIESEPNSTHAKALDQVVTQLLSLPPASTAATPATPAGQGEEKEAGADSAAIVKVLEATLGALSKKSS